MTASTPPDTRPSDPRSALRQQLKAARQAWASDPATLASAQAALQDKLMEVLRQLEPECLGLYWPIQAEFNPRPAALMAQKEWSCQLALPWAARATREMHYRPWLGDELTTVDECGIPSPPGRPCEPDVVLVPCLGFTPDGFRLGYGGGYFDRFLAKHPDVTAVGIAWSQAQLDPTVISSQPHDFPLIGVVTELQIFGS